MSRPWRSSSSLTRIGRNSETASALTAVAMADHIATAVSALAVSLFLPMRVSVDDERQGLDIASHGERGWEFD